MNLSLAYAEKAKPIGDEILKGSKLLNHTYSDEVKTFRQRLEAFENAYKNCNSNNSYSK